MLPSWNGRQVLCEFYRQPLEARFYDWSARLTNATEKECRGYGESCEIATADLLQQLIDACGARESMARQRQKVAPR